MKLYTDIGGTAPSPRRVRILLAEKGVEIPFVEMKLHEENRTEEFREKNPIRTLPVLEVDDGTFLSESLAICRYFEDLHPEPSLFGRTPLERATIEMWSKRVELMLYLPIEFAGGDDWLSPKAAEVFRSGALRSMRFLDRQLAERPFIAGRAYSIADLIAQVALDFGVAYQGFSWDPAHANLLRWHAEVSARPSARA